MAFVIPKLLSIRSGVSEEHVKISCYQPILVFRQFGLNQLFPKSFFNRNKELCLCNFNFSEDEYTEHLDQDFARAAKLTPLSFRASFYCTKEFDTRWRSYYAKEYYGVSVLSKHLTNSFYSEQMKFKKGRDKHIK